MEINIISNETIAHYLNRNFVTPNQIHRATGNTFSEIKLLEEGGCIPRPSYVLKALSNIYSPLTEISEDFTAQASPFYAPSVIQWIDKVNQLNLQDAAAIAQELRKAFELEFLDSLVERSAKEHGLSELFDSEGKLNKVRALSVAAEKWRHAIHGVYGICIQGPVTADNIVRKWIAVQRVAKLTDNGQRPAIDSATEKQLVDALLEFDEIVAHFAPHDWPVSSRKRLFDDLIPRYNLTKRFPNYRVPS